MAASRNHAFIHITLGAELHALKKYSVFSELSLDINGTEYKPDICLYPIQEINFAQDVIRVSEIPLGCIELSPTQSTYEITEKFKIYFNEGVKSCWLVIPVAQAVVVYESPDKSKIFSSGNIVDNMLDITIPIEKIYRT